MTFLVFQLKAPMASFGSSQGGLRLSDRQPTKSALTGLLAAALGIRREEQARFERLAQAVNFAVLTIKKPFELVDFHTVQAPIDRLASSRAAQIDQIRGTLASGKKYSGTIVTRREYLQDGHWVICLESEREQAESLKLALESPKFSLYLGRKSCVLSKFTAPAVIEADSAEEAVEAWASTLSLELPETAALAWDPSIPCRTAAQMVTRRNDQRTSLMRNHFVPRSQNSGEAVFKKEGQV